jgi:anti-sigma B factor antagonist
MAEFVNTEPRDDGGCTITVSGEVDIATVEEFLAAAESCLAGGAQILEVDLGAVSFIDSSGLGALVRIRNQALEGGSSIVLKDVPPVVARLLEVTGLDAAFESSD